MNETTFLQELGTNISIAQTRAKVNSTKLARELGVSNVTITNYRAGKTAIALPQLLKVATILNTTINDLIPNTKEN